MKYDAFWMNATPSQLKAQRRYDRLRGLAAAQQARNEKAGNKARVRAARREAAEAGRWVAWKMSGGVQRARRKAAREERHAEYFKAKVLPLVNHIGRK